MNNLRDSYFSKDSVGADLLLCQVSVQFYCFFVFRFMMPEENLVCFVYAFISSSWWFDAHSTKIFSVYRTPKALIARDHSKTSHKVKFETQIRYLVYISKGFFDWSMTFLQWKFKKRLSSFIQTWFEQFRFSCCIWPTEWVSKVVQIPVFSKD